VIAIRSLWRVLAWTGVMGRRLRSEGRKGKDRWPDKSTAVGVGVGDWISAIISDAARNARLSVNSIYAMISMQITASVLFAPFASRILR
jgi:hypothetical protein